MRKQGKICALLFAAFLLTLLGGSAAMRPKVAPRNDAPPTEDVPPIEVPAPRPDLTTENKPEPEPTAPLWDVGHHLEIEIPRIPAGGLELPVEGATGYASIELPLWPELPEDGEGTLNAIDAKLAALAEEQRAAEETAADAEAEEDSETAEAEPSCTEPATKEDAAPKLSQEDISDMPQDPEEAENTVMETPQDDSETSGETPETQLTEPLPEEMPGDAEPADTEPADTAEEPLPQEAVDSNDPYANAAAILRPGTAFTVLLESGDWWLVSAEEGVGWIEHRYCLVNLPDVIPSMIYNATNSYASLFVSCGKELPKITGTALYPGAAYNARLGRSEYMMPVLYAMAKDICHAQQTALSEGNTLVLYEGYRPYKTQRAVVAALSALSRDDQEVHSAIADPPWSIAWFIATGYSNHQRGFAIDVSLAKITEAELEIRNGCSCVKAVEYEEYAMPTPIHELSRAAATFTAPVATFSYSAWRSAELSPAMAASDPALALQRYCTETGVLAPLASEWWHFNDLAARGQVLNHMSVGDYVIQDVRSVSPSDARSAAEEYLRNNP